MDGQAHTDNSDQKSAEPQDAVPTLSIAELEADPHGVFRRYRPRMPFTAHEAGGYLVLRARDLERVFRDPRVQSTETVYPEMRGITDGVLFALFEQGMLTSNGGVHRRRRSPFTRTFAARLIEELRPRIRQTAEDLIASWSGEDEIDLVERYTAMIPAQTISGLLGLPLADIPHFTRLVYDVSRVLSFTFQPEDIPTLEAAARELQAYVEKILAEKRRTPNGDFLSRYLAEAEASAELAPLEIIVQIVQLIIGGTDTTRVAGAMQVALLLEHPEQWQAVCRDPDLIPGAVAEALRYEPSVASIGRVSREDMELDGLTLPAGSFLMLSTMSAMRDEMVYARPDVFDIRRTDHPRLHPVYGGGPHRCIGEALARVELEEGLTALIRRIPQLGLAGTPPKLQGHSGIRRIDQMHVAWTN
ncbi:Cytochrome P450-pinF1, plant-inducible [Methylobacterium crusticola]|uniref:Cytochrome P450-pinF1, plant-inducible n=1 Tax=Methylobacterium crusticola TaxID=1697972 RepID=A0ABQ4R919_9HYPH|nr:cytochrome P450 [Methylobacterium crusticola]GJD53831.1 Cytochrome P450-pinF1, plant-inducible [Methylobacterium crusticola]